MGFRSLRAGLTPAEPAAVDGANLYNRSERNAAPAVAALVSTAC
jgi:hypothetical protein